MMSHKILKYFQYAHLPEHLQEVSKPFCELAFDVASKYPDSEEKDVGLRKLLEAKDCIVRASMEKGA